METPQQIVERLRKADEAAAAEDAKRLAAIKQKYAEQKAMEADLQATVRAKQAEERKAAQEANLKADIRSGYQLLSDAEFEEVYPQLRVAELMRRSQAAAQAAAQRTIHAFST